MVVDKLFMFIYMYSAICVLQNLDKMKYVIDNPLKICSFGLSKDKI